MPKIEEGEIVKYAEENGERNVGLVTYIKDRDKGIVVLFVFDGKHQSTRFVEATYEAVREHEKATPGTYHYV